MSRRGEHVLHTTLHTRHVVFCFNVHTDVSDNFIFMCRVVNTNKDILMYLLLK